jgi:putative inorganic carbon (HCO3(-)) transporter
LIIVFLGYFALIQKESSFDARIVIWQEAWEVFKANPILGIGPGTFGNYFPPYPELGVPQPHNIFLAFLLQTGIIGFIGFIWLLIWFFRTGVKLFIVHCSLFTVTLMSVMVYILVHGLIDTTYWKNDLSVLFWTVIALMVVFRHLKIRNFIR